MGAETRSIQAITSELRKVESGLGKAEGEFRRSKPQRSVDAMKQVRDILTGVNQIIAIRENEEHTAVKLFRKASDQVDAARQHITRPPTDAERAIFQVPGKKLSPPVDLIGKASDQVKTAGQLLARLPAAAERTIDAVTGKEQPSAFEQAGKEVSPGGHALESTPVSDVGKPLLQVAGPTHSGVRVRGLGAFFSARYIHAQRSTGVVTANFCTLTSIDRYRVHKADLSMRQLVESKTAKAALKELVARPHAMFAVSEFRDAIQSLRTPPRPSHETRVSMPVTPDHVTSVNSCTAVQQGDHSSMSVNTHYVVEQTTLPLVDLLLDDAQLVRLLSAALTERVPGHHTAVFLRHSLRVGGWTEDLALLNHASGLEAPDTSVLAFFGVATVDEAPAIMVGGDNQLKTGVKFHRPTIGEGDLVHNLKKLRGSVGTPYVVLEPHAKNHRFCGGTEID
jgi:hypothetical protein